MRRSLTVVLGGILMACLLVPIVALAEERPDPSGTYLGTVKGSSGATFEAWAQLGRSRLGYTILTVKVADKPSFPIPLRPVWTSANSFTVNPTVWVPGLVDGSGTAMWTQQGETWAVAGEGKGSVLDKPEGSGSGQGVRVSTEYITPPLKAGPIDGTAGSTAATAGANAQQSADAAGGALVSAGVIEQAQGGSDGGNVEAGLASGVAVIAGLLLCIFLGASMSGAEFAELWMAPEGSKS
jgi:hypothetical protein